MWSCIFFSTVNASIWYSTLLIVRSWARPFHGVGWQVGCSSRLSPSDTSTVGFCSFLFFKQGVSQLLGVLAKPWGFCSNIEGSTFSFCYLSFSGGGSEVSGNFITFLRLFPEGVWCLLLLASQPCLIWIFVWGLRSWGSFQGWIYSISLEGVPKLLENISCRSRAIWIESFPAPDPLIISVVTTLVARLLF